MDWQKGFKRIRLIGPAAQVAGVAMLPFSTWLTQLPGHAPAPAYTGSYRAFTPSGFRVISDVSLPRAMWMRTGFLSESAALQAKLSTRAQLL